MARKKRIVKNKSLPRFLPEFLIVVGTLLVSLSVIHNSLRFKALSISKQTVETYADSYSDDNQSLHPVHIFIPWNTDADIKPGVYVNNAWTVDPDNVTYLSNSALPGESGNIIIYGHNKRSILGNIRALKGGEKITLKLEDGSDRVYKVEKTMELAPSDTTPLLPTDHEVLTLFTCSGIFDSMRFVVQAIPVDEF